MMRGIGQPMMLVPIPAKPYEQNVGADVPVIRRRQRMPTRHVLTGVWKRPRRDWHARGNLGKTKSAPMWRRRRPASSCAIGCDQVQSRRRARDREARRPGNAARVAGRAEGKRAAGPWPARVPGGSRSGRQSRSALHTGSTGPP